MSYPEVQPGGSLLLAWQVRNKRVLVIGGGEVAAGRILSLLNASALITLVAPTPGLAPETAHRLATHPDRITHHDRVFQPSDLDDPALALVLAAVDSPAVSTSVYSLCREKRIPCNVADVPPQCDFYFGSTHRDGPLQIMVSTNGNGPRLARIVRRGIAAALPENVGKAVEKVGELRRRLRTMAPGAEEGGKRMGWMSRVCEAWGLEELCKLREVDMERLLEFYERDLVPSWEQVRSGEGVDGFGFDGSFGWCCVV